MACNVRVWRVFGREIQDGWQIFLHFQKLIALHGAVPVLREFGRESKVAAVQDTIATLMMSFAMIDESNTRLIFETIHTFDHLVHTEYVVL